MRELDPGGLADEGALRTFALRDIANVGHRQEGPIRRDGAEGDVDGKLRAVLAPPRQLQAGPHRPGLGICEVAVAVRNVDCPELIGEQDLDRPADQLLARVAEEAFGLLVDERDPPAAVDDDRRVRGEVQQRPEALLARPEDLNETGRRRPSDLQLHGGFIENGRRTHRRSGELPRGPLQKLRLIALGAYVHGPSLCRRGTRAGDAGWRGANARLGNKSRTRIVGRNLGPRQTQMAYRVRSIRTIFREP